MTKEKMKLKLHDLVMFYSSTTHASFELINELKTVRIGNKKTTMCATNNFKFDANNLKILHKHPTSQDEYVYDNDSGGVVIVVYVWRFNENKNWELIR